MPSATVRFRRTFRPGLLAPPLLLLSLALLASCNGAHDPGVSEPDNTVSTLTPSDGNGSSPQPGNGGRENGETAGANGKDPGPTPAPTPPAEYKLTVHHVIQHNRLYLEMATRDPSQAKDVVSEYRQRAGENAKDPAARFLYGWALMLTGDVEKAVTQFEKARSLRAGFFWADFGLALTYSQLLKKTPGDKALEAKKEKAVRALERDTDSPSDQLWKSLLIGEIFVIMDKKKAESIFERIRQKYPKSPDPVIALARYYANEKQYPRSLKLLDKAVVIAPKDPLIPFYKARVFLQMAGTSMKANPQSARQHLQTSRSLFRECRKKLPEESELNKVVDAFLELVGFYIEPWVKLVKFALDKSKPVKQRIAAAHRVLLMGPQVPVKYFVMLVGVEDKNPHIRKRGIQGLAYHPTEEALNACCDVLREKVKERIYRHDYTTAAETIRILFKKDGPALRKKPPVMGNVFWALHAALAYCLTKPWDGWEYKFEDVHKALVEVTGHTPPASADGADKLLAHWKAFGDKTYPAGGTGGGGEKDGEGEKKDEEKKD